jgi:hypothetical protein
LKKDKTRNICINLRVKKKDRKCKSAHNIIITLRMLVVIVAAQEVVNNIVMTDRCVTKRCIASAVGIKLWERVHCIGMKTPSGRCVLRILE